MMLPDTSFRKAFLLLLVATMTVVLIILLKSFALTIVVAAVMAGLCRPARRCGGRR